MTREIRTKLFDCQKIQSQSPKLKKSWLYHTPYTIHTLCNSFVIDSSRVLSIHSISRLIKILGMPTQQNIHEVYMTAMNSQITPNQIQTEVLIICGCFLICRREVLTAVSVLPNQFAVNLA